MRSSPHISHPSTFVMESIEHIQRQEVRFVIDQRGPSKFIVKSLENRKESYTVSIGLEQKCTCKDTEVCIHVLYVMIRFFGVPTDCDILWQKSLTEHEIDQILDGRVKRRPAPPKPQPIYKTKSGKAKVKRLPINDEDVCPICYDELKGCDKNKIAWCRCGCGGNFHKKCVKAWIDSRKAYGEQPTCPMCRQPLDMLGINGPPKKPPPNAPPPLSQDEIRDMMSRDLSPDDYDLLLRLDQVPVGPSSAQRNTRIRRPRQNNQRTQAAAQIIANAPALDLQVTGTTAHVDQPRQNSQQQHATNNAVHPRRTPNFGPVQPFLAEITSTGPRIRTDEEVARMRNEDPMIHQQQTRTKTPGQNPWHGGTGGARNANRAQRAIFPPKHQRDRHAQRPTGFDSDGLNLFVSNFA